MKGFQGGTVSLSGSDVVVEASTVPLPSGFDFNSAVPSDLIGTLHIAASAISGQGFKEIDLGDPNLTQTVIIQHGSILDASSITLSAQNSITLESGAQINALDTSGTGSASLICPNGQITLQANSVVHASDSLALNMGQVDFQGDIKVDHGSLNLSGGNIFFLTDGYSGPQTLPGLYLTSKLWKEFDSIANVTVSGSSVDFLGNLALTAQKSFTIDAARIAGEAVPGSANPLVTITSQTLSLLNTGDTAPNSTLANAGSLSLNATEISLGKGNTLFDGFRTVNFTADKDITFRGTGSITTGADLKFSSAASQPHFTGLGDVLPGRKFQRLRRRNCHDPQGQRPAGPDFCSRRHPGDQRQDNRRLRDHRLILRLPDVNSYRIGPWKRRLPSERL